MNEITAELLNHSTDRMQENTDKISTCFNELNDDEIWKLPNDSLSSVGNLILHLCGNIGQYAISSLGHRPDIRERDKEFAALQGFSKGQLLEKLVSTVNDAKSTILNCDEAELLRIRSVQGYSMSGIGIIVHVTEHYSYHTGQIIFWTKILRNKDLGFYAGVDLNQKI